MPESKTISKSRPKQVAGYPTEKNCGVSPWSTRRRRARYKLAEMRNSRPLVSSLPKCSSVGDANKTTPSHQASSPPFAGWRNNLIRPLFHLSKCGINSSSDELTFLSFANRFGLEVATYLATKAGWQRRRPLLVLLLMSNARGKSCTKRSPSSGQLVGLPASLRKPSSGARTGESAFGS